MKTIIIYGFFALLFAACGGSSRGSRSASADMAYAPKSANKSAPMEESAALDDDGEYFYEENDALLDLSMEPAESMPPGAPARSSISADYSQNDNGSMESPPPTPLRDTTHTDRQKHLTPEGPMIVYNGYLHLRVRRLLDALNSISDITNSNGGYVESMTKNAIVVRIPGDQFEEMISTFSKLGDLLSKEISAIEVTAQYTDLKSRLKVADETHKRLLALLEKVRDSRERLRILEEIKRLSEQIESIKSTLSTLRNLLKYFTITIDLTPIIEDDAAIQHQSPFPWVRALSAHRMTLFGGAKTVSMKLPSDFVLFTKDDDYRAQAADTTIVRGGVVANNPKGNNQYWSDSIAYEMRGRSETLEKEGSAGKVSYLLFKNDNLQPRWYLIGLHVQKEQVYVIEVFFPNETAFAAHQDNILKALETFEVKQ